MGSDRFDIRWIGYQETDKKIWGWYLDGLRSGESIDLWRPRSCFCFWAVCGKTISIKEHSYRLSHMEGLINKKVANGYRSMSTDELISIWPSFMEDLHRRVIFESLSSDALGGNQWHQ